MDIIIIIKQSPILWWDDIIMNIDPKDWPNRRQKVKGSKVSILKLHLQYT